MTSNSTPRYIHHTHTKKNTNWERYMHPVVITAVFTIAKIWDQPKCSSIDEWMKKMWYMYTHTHTHIYSGILLSHKKEWNIAFCNNVDGLGDIVLSEKGQTEKDKYCMISYVESKKYSKLVLEQTNKKIDSQIRKTHYGYQFRERCGEG